MIGVHSPKFEHEKNVDHLRRTLDRLGIDHPVAQDAEFRIWREYTVRAWPTLVLIDPAGYVVASVSGEGHMAELDQVIAAVIAVFDERGELNRDPIEAIGHEPPAGLRAGVEGGTLRYPGAVLADPAKGRLFVADTGHHRVLVCGLDGAVRDVIGAGDIAGFANGSFEDAELDSPQGLAIAGDTLYIADRGTHTIRAVDLDRAAGEDDRRHRRAGLVGRRRRRGARDAAGVAVGPAWSGAACCSWRWPASTRSG